MNLLYFGNKTSSYAVSKSMTETLEPLLGELGNIRTCSSVKNKVLRLLDMMFFFFKNYRRADWILIDVYSTTAFKYAEIIGSLARRKNKKYALILRGGNLPQKYQKDSLSIDRLFKPAAKIIAPSPYLKHYFEEQGYAVVHIPNIIELKNYEFTHRKFVRPKALALRGFKPTYNVFMTLEALKICKSQGCAIETLFLATPDEGDYAAAMDFIKTNQLEDIVRVQNKMPKEEWVILSKDYDMMLSNPVIDNTPISVLEGMALGMCVISTEVGGIPYLFKDKEELLLVPSNDAEALAKGMTELINNATLAQKLSQNARKRAAQFDWEVVKKEWEKILKK